jgi:hypothetical protein
MICPPWALALPLNPQDIGTSRWQLRIEGYTNWSFIRKRAVAAGYGPVQAPRPSAVASGRWGAPVAGVMWPNRRWTRRLARVRNRSKFRRGGHEARWLSLTHS